MGKSQKAKRTQLNVRLSESGRKLLLALAQKTDLSQRTIIELALKHMAKQEKIAVDDMSI